MFDVWLVWLVWLLWLVCLVWFNWFGWFGLVGLFGLIGLIGLVGLVRLVGSTYFGVFEGLWRLLNYRVGTALGKSVWSVGGLLDTRHEYFTA